MRLGCGACSPSWGGRSPRWPAGRTPGLRSTRFCGIAATYQRLKSEQIAEMVESAAGPEAQEVIVTWLEEIEVRGRTAGRKEMGAELLLTLLGERFGAVSAEVRAKVAAADNVTLSRWAVQVLTAGSIDDALAERRRTAPDRRP